MQSGSKCGFCGRKIKTPLVRASGLGFCCNSCFRAHLALHDAGKKEGPMPVKKSKTKKMSKKNGKRSR